MYFLFILGCSQSLTLEYLKSTETTCNILSDCTGFQCCVDTVVIDMSFLFKISVDACKYKLTGGIDTVKITALSNHKPGILNNYIRIFIFNNEAL
jgi:hypothetical protein